MIRLNNNPMEGSTARVNLSFRDSLGKYYVPLKLTYTLLALNNDNESWSVVDDHYKVELNPASQVVLTLKDLALVEGTGLERKVLVEWTAYVDEAYEDFVDEVTFSIQPQPYVSNRPDDPEPSVIYVKVSDVKLQIGSLVSTPLIPVFQMTTNLPVVTDDVSAKVTDGSDEVSCTVEIDSVGTSLAVTPNVQLTAKTSYTLTLSGLKSKVGDLEMEDDFTVSFITSEAAPLQELKFVTVEDNHTTTIVTPDTGYEGLKEVRVITNLPETAGTKKAVSMKVEFESNGHVSRVTVVTYDGSTFNVNTVTSLLLTDIPSGDYGFDFYSDDGIINNINEFVSKIVESGMSTSGSLVNLSDTIEFTDGNFAFGNSVIYLSFWQ